MAGEVTVDNTVMVMMEVEEMTLAVAIRDGRGGTLTMNNLESRHQVCSVNSSPLLLIKLTSTRGVENAHTLPLICIAMLK